MHSPAPAGYATTTPPPAPPVRLRTPRAPGVLEKRTDRDDGRDAAARREDDTMGTPTKGEPTAHTWDIEHISEDELEHISEESRAAHGEDSGLSWTTIAVVIGSVLLLAILAGLAIWAGASFSGGQPGTTAPAGG
ncbi:hypothetical protein GCM10023205_74650 [Yinghuangia aomiensis]|uniref:Uncharacterized protein n=2 Tax=Kitasatosporales TaxID=85011 RepID=A0ABP9I9P3_9ACTN